MARKLILAFSLLTIPLLSACSQTVSNPCDVLVGINPSADTSRYIVTNDKDFARSVASHRQRFIKYGC